jgi:hypothetical protein
MADQPYTDAEVKICVDWLYSAMHDDRQIPEMAENLLEDLVPAIEARAKAQVLREEADKTIAETVCCDEYEAFKAGVARPKYPHHICYWGAAHAEALRARATEIEEAHRG